MTDVAPIDAAPAGSLARAWNQRRFAVILRREGQKLRARFPFRSDNREWLRNGRRSIPAWHTGLLCWELPRAWFNDLVDRALERFDGVYVIQPWRKLEICAPACLNAHGHECSCSCMGANHGQGNDGTWFEVSETFAVRSGGRMLACRLLRAKAREVA